jgi:hypothetical protein
VHGVTHTLRNSVTDKPKFGVRLKPSGQSHQSDVRRYVFVRKLLDYVRSECSHSGVVEKSRFPEYDGLLIDK